MCKISVIIPVYNTQEFVESAIRSIQTQSLRDIEIIVINDGSTDNSLNILETLRANDPRLKLFSQQNSGQAIARNKGLSEAKGTYIYFMDSDDILESDALELCYNYAETEQLDLVFFDAESFSEAGIDSTGYTYDRCGMLTKKVYTGPEIFGELMLKDQFRVAPWLQIIRKKFLDEINLTYEKVTHEDELFSTLLFIQARRVGFINRKFFHRRLRSNSVVTTPFSSKNVEAYFYITDKLLSFSERYPAGSAERRLLTLRAKNVIQASLFKARSFSLKRRTAIFRKCIHKYPGLVGKDRYLLFLIPLLSKIKK